MPDGAGRIVTNRFGAMRHTSPGRRIPSRPAARSPEIRHDPLVGVTIVSHSPDGRKVCASASARFRRSTVTAASDDSCSVGVMLVIRRVTRLG
ncbi:hypothetical protein ADL15_21570 [Actinoplanes awajinensis subsp. mycoplanecinus]|uniref:Uncharacterized protein n=1 Tax=Actinoplanes awajinensis subsp. mycoplanecinus TaxID=135947 RepID=A0A117MRG6_9ACTN|nr:hypothetical protein ADL15_21570 [Actinoplanes awajinensis subsp. mycoplanecinus]